MRDLSRIEVAILMQLRKIIANNEDVKLTDVIELTETDEISKVRELVFYLDSLVQKNYIEVEENYYEENETVTFNYINAAISIDTDKIKLAEKSLEMFCNNKYSKLYISREFIITIVTHLLAFSAGMLLMYFIIINYGVF